ncbi:UDP-N-acetyl-D-mannosamine dehydrogenase [Psychromonas sp. MME2]|uniref:UDP-N-acetyl-D-mannosamine dehydrogenase n=1 Tax=unclassified Psychromonas TaxID=2614957 RepID=UPI00339CF228
MDSVISNVKVPTSTFKKVSVIGLGYIGLPTAAIIASRGVEVVGVEVNQTAVETINAGKIHIVEPDLDIVVRSVVSTNSLRAVTIAEPADAFIVAVPTPFIHSNDDSHQPDLSYIKSAANTIAPVLEKGNLVILESTSPVGTTEKLAAWLAEARPDLSFPQDKEDDADIKIAYCPERVLPGHVLQELVSNDRVIGGMSKTCSDLAVELYRIFVRGECIITNARTAEMAKLTENSFRDVNIAFANELSVISDKLKINVWELIALANRHPRVNILNPGPGVGGHCIAVDPWFIVDSCPEEAQLIRQARLTNDHKPHYVVKQVIQAADEFKRPVIACLGLSFKADIDDLRESPALQIVEQLMEKNIGQLLAVEPNIKSLPQYLQTAGVKFATLKSALEEANVIVILVDHHEFKTADKTQFATKVVIDTRGIL